MLDMYNINEVERGVESPVYFDYYLVKSNATIYEIAKKENVNPALLAALNGLDATDQVYPGAVIMIPSKEYSYYITKKGDSLEIVASIFNTNAVNLIKVNPTIYLQEGQVIVSKIK